jgi:hypothetical protein
LDTSIIYHHYLQFLPLLILIVVGLITLYFMEWILETTCPARYPAEATDDYLSWYYQVSHPKVCCTIDGSHGAPPVLQYEPPQYDPLQPDVPDDLRVTAIVEATDDYLLWYYRVSHPKAFRTIDGPYGAPLVPQYHPLQLDVHGDLKLAAIVDHI